MYMARAQIPPSAAAAISLIFDYFTVKITVETDENHTNKGLRRHI